MMSPDDDEPKELVRRFSEKIQLELEIDSTEEPKELKESLVEDHKFKERGRRIQDIEAFLEAKRPDEQLQLLRCRKDLETAMKSFFTSLSKSDQDRDFFAQPASWPDIKATVEKRIADWEQKRDASKFRKAIKDLRKCCNTIGNHKTALTMMPQGSQYASLFTGALATVVQASKTYTKMLEVLPSALVELNDCVGIIERELWLFDTDSMKSLAWRLYSQIFSLLTHTINWYNQRSYQRLLHSLNEDLDQFFKERLDEIRRITALISQEVSFRTSANTQINKLWAENFHDELNNHFFALKEELKIGSQTKRYEDFVTLWYEKDRRDLENDMRLEAKMDAIFRQLRRMGTGSVMAEMLESQGSVKQAEWHQKEGHLSVDWEVESAKSASSCGEEADSEFSLSIMKPHTDARRLPTFQSQTRDGIILASKHLEDYFHRNKIQPQDIAGNATAPQETISQMEGWATTMKSGILCLSGSEASEENFLSGLAGRYCQHAREQRMPVVSYFCRLSRKEPPPRRTRETIETSSLVYALIRQLIELLPTQLEEGAPRFEDARFEKLNGMMDTWDQALSLLEDLLATTGHRILVLVIDGFHTLDDLERKSTTTKLKAFLEVLRRKIDSSEPRILKILFTTAGRSAALNQSLRASEISLTTGSERRKGRPVPGRDHVSF